MPQWAPAEWMSGTTPKPSAGGAWPGKGGPRLTCAASSSHFHLDHCGALPYFSEMVGYDGPIYMTHPTQAICPILLEDYRKIAVDKKGEANFFTSQMIKDCMKKVVAVHLHQTVQVRVPRLPTGTPQTAPAACSAVWKAGASGLGSPSLSCVQHCEDTRRQQWASTQVPAQMWHLAWGVYMVTWYVCVRACVFVCTCTRRLLCLSGTEEARGEPTGSPGRTQCSGTFSAISGEQSPAGETGKPLRVTSARCGDLCLGWEGVKNIKQASDKSGSVKVSHRDCGFAYFHWSLWVLHYLF